MSLTSRRTVMARKRYKPEEVVAKLRAPAEQRQFLLLANVADVPILCDRARTGRLARCQSPDSQQLSRQSKVSTDQRGMTHESADFCGPAVPRLERARSRGYVRLRLQRRGRRYRDVQAASGRFAAAGTALQGCKARDAYGGEPGQALPHRCRALQAVP